MILDTSAVIAILQREPEAPALASAIAEAPSVSVSAATLVEIGMVAEGRAGPEMRSRVERLMEQAEVQVMPFTAAQAGIALDAWRRFGKGRHPAALNLGDCFAYALARETDEPLLFKGEEFARTDVKAAL